jgi:hypothetical protein
MQTKTVKISEIKPNPNNPRLIKNDKFEKLVKSIKEFPKMLEIRPIVVNADMIVLGGNMRLKACKEAGLKEVSIIFADDLTDEEQKQFIIKDNVGFGEWDWDMIANEWESDLIEDWGLDIPIDETLNIKNHFNNLDNPYTGKVEAPKYEPSEEKPQFVELYDKTKFEILIEEIESSSLNKEHKEFLKLAATRHIVFNYAKIADMYAHSDKQMQEHMENSALVIIDFEKAIELGYVKLSEEIASQYLEDHG